MIKFMSFFVKVVRSAYFLSFEFDRKGAFLPDAIQPDLRKILKPCQAVGLYRKQGYRLSEENNPLDQVSAILL